jgi:hypothetical protein
MRATYWDRKGKWQKHAEYLERFPSEGDAALKCMAEFHEAVRVYYDLYNNGGCNLKPGETTDVLGVYIALDLALALGRDWWDDEVTAEHVELAMDRIILETFAKVKEWELPEVTE